MKSPASLAALLENFFTQRLMNQRQASPHTISSYRDTFRLLLQFAQQRLHKSPALLAFEQIDDAFILGIFIISPVPFENHLLRFFRGQQGNVRYRLIR